VARTRKIRLRVGVRTKGIKPAQRSLRRAEETLDANMAIGVYRGMLAIARRQKFLAPVGRHGSIPRSIRVLPARRVGKAFVSSSQTSLPLAFFHEGGTGTHFTYGAEEAADTLYRQVGRSFVR
jgi:hypothetical protein